MVSMWIDLFKLDECENWTIFGPKPSLLPLFCLNHFIFYFGTSIDHIPLSMRLFITYRTLDHVFDIFGLIWDSRRNYEFHTKNKICRTLKNRRISFPIFFIDDFLSSLCLWRNRKLYQNK